MTIQEHNPGLHLSIFFQTLCSILANKERSSTLRSRMPWKSWLQIALITLLFINAGLNFVGNALLNQWAWIDYRNYPNGPLAFLIEQQANWPSGLANISGILVIFLADAVLVCLYRAFSCF
jgi:hypothetical protein